jgi:tellurite resistance protein TerC
MFQVYLFRILTLLGMLALIAGGCTQPVQTSPSVSIRATPSFSLLVLLTVETTDLVFALDSIPAIFAITTDPFVIFTSNIFAILGLRSLYFLLARAVGKFHYLQTSLAIILFFVEAKMLIAHWFKMPIGISLFVIVTVLVAGVVASLLRERRKKKNNVLQRLPSEIETE